MLCFFVACIAWFFFLLCAMQELLCLFLLVFFGGGGSCLIPPPHTHTQNMMVHPSYHDVVFEIDNMDLDICQSMYVYYKLGLLLLAVLFCFCLQYIIHMYSIKWKIVFLFLNSVVNKPATHKIHHLCWTFILLCQWRWLEIKIKLMFYMQYGVVFLCHLSQFLSLRILEWQ